MKILITSLIAAALLCLSGCSTYTVTTKQGRQYQSSKKPKLDDGVYHLENDSGKIKVMAPEVESISKT